VLVSWCVDVFVGLMRWDDCVNTLVLPVLLYVGKKMVCWCVDVFI
jgi:hypothetical protein